MRKGAQASVPAGVVGVTRPSQHRAHRLARWGFETIDTDVSSPKYLDSTQTDKEPAKQPWAKRRI